MIGVLTRLSLAFGPVSRSFLTHVFARQESSRAPVRLTIHKDRLPLPCLFGTEDLHVNGIEVHFGSWDIIDQDAPPRGPIPCPRRDIIP